MELEDRDKVVPNLRIQSRRMYLEKRKEDKVAELEADILDDEYLFDDKVYVSSRFIVLFLSVWLKCLRPNCIQCICRL